MLRISTKLLARLPATRQHPAAVVEGPIGGLMYESACPHCRVVPHLGISNVLDTTPMVTIRGSKWCQLTDTSEPMEWKDLHSDTYVFYDDYMAGIVTTVDGELNTLSAAIRSASTSYSKTNPHMAEVNLERLVAAEFTGHGAEHDVSSHEAEEDIDEEIRCSGSSSARQLYTAAPQANADAAHWSELNTLSAAIRSASAPYSKTNPHMAEPNLERLVEAEYTGHDAEHDVSSHEAEEDIDEEIRCSGSSSDQDAKQFDHEAYAVGDDELNNGTTVLSTSARKKKAVVKPLSFNPIPLDVASLLKFTMTPKQRSSSTSATASSPLMGPKDIDGPTMAAAPTPPTTPLSNETTSTASTRRPRTWSAKKAMAQQRR